MCRKISLFASAMSLAVLAGCATVRAPSASYDAEAPSGDTTGRRISYSADLTVGVCDIPESVAAAQKIFQEAGGQVDRHSLGDLRADLHARVPPDRFNETLARLCKLGEVRYRRLGEEDLTDQIVDLQARRQNLESLRDRLRALLERAQKIDEILAIERELTRVQSELDSMAARGEALGDRVKWSDVDLTLERKAVPGPVGFVLKWAWRVVEKLFVWRPGV